MDGTSAPNIGEARETVTTLVTFPTTTPHHGERWRMTINTDFLARWLKYCDHRNDTAHLYGETLAEATLDLLPAFIGRRDGAGSSDRPEQR